MAPYEGAEVLVGPMKQVRDFQSIEALIRDLPRQISFRLVCTWPGYQERLDAGDCDE